jgi:hypothetical protein
VTDLTHLHPGSILGIYLSDSESQLDANGSDTEGEEIKGSSPNSKLTQKKRTIERSNNNNNNKKDTTKWTYGMTMLLLRKKCEFASREKQERSSDGLKDLNALKRKYGWPALLEDLRHELERKRDDPHSRDLLDLFQSVTADKLKSQWQNITNKWKVRKMYESIPFPADAIDRSTMMLSQELVKGPKTALLTLNHLSRLIWKSTLSIWIPTFQSKR